MAGNVLKANFPLIVYGERKEPWLEMEQLGAKVVESARQLGEESDTILVVNCITIPHQTSPVEYKLV